MSEFLDRVRVHFGFLTADYGFSSVRSDVAIGELAEYKRYPLVVGVGWYKGEIDVAFSLDLQAAIDHEIFRPYISRTFLLREIVLKEDENAYAGLSRVGPIMTTAQADIVLAQEAEFMKRYCSPLLRGDLTQLETITMERRSNAHA